MILLKRLLLSSLLGLCFASSLVASSNDLPRLDRNNLLLHRNKGEILTSKKRLDWELRRAEIVRGMETIMGPLPGTEKRIALDAQIHEEVDCGVFVRRFITYASEPSSRTPAYLLIPKTALKENTKCPSVLALHPTEMQWGHKVVVGLGESKYPDYGRELAERGFVVLAPSYPLMANYQPDLKALGYQSGTMKAIWDNMRGIDLLESLPFVKPGGVGAIGHSLGGHNSIYTAAFEPRIKVIVSSCGFDSFLDYMDGRIQGWTQERYMPKLANYATSLETIPFDFQELIAALAPRFCLVNAPTGDNNFKWKSVDKIAAAAGPVFRLYGAESNLRVEHPECGHEFSTEMRTLAYEILGRHLDGK